MKLPSILQPIFNTFSNIFEKYWKQFRKYYIAFSQKYPRINENIQLSFVYFFGLVDLFQSFLNSLFSLGYFPEILTSFFPFIESFLLSPFFQIWASPEKVFFLSYLVIELMIIRSIFGFSKLVKYNILMVFALLMLQSLVASYWDVCFHREIAIKAVKWSYDKGTILFSDETLLVFLYFNTFLLFVFSYLFLYFRALQGKYVVIPTFEWLTDSIAFWVRIKTPTMRIGNQNLKSSKETPQQQKDSTDIDDLFDEDDLDEDDNGESKTDPSGNE